MTDIDLNNDEDIAMRVMVSKPNLPRDNFKDLEDIDRKDKEFYTIILIFWRAIKNWQSFS